ncbi:MAG: hypothetical protein VYE68_11875 [Acidobacteriota bacterium]|nr:hypothetical protein [Acidobacteriota bacterium]
MRYSKFMFRYSLTKKTCGPAVVVGLFVGLATLAPLHGVEGLQQTGTIHGVVTMADPPSPSTLEVTTDQMVCGDAVPNEEIIADADGHVANVVVRLTGVPWPAEALAPAIDNEACLFVPHVQIVPTRSQLLVTSQDDTLHSTHSYDDRNRTGFNIAMPFAGMEVNRPLRRPGVVRIECDSHAWMRGWVVVSNDVGAVSGVDGVFTIAGVPAGAHELTIWHERLVASPQTVTVTAGAVTEVTVALEPAG